MKISKSDLIKAVKEKCKDCCLGEMSEIKACEIKTCPLVPVKNLFYSGENFVQSVKSNRGCKELTLEHKAKLAAGRERKRLESLNK